MTLRNSQAILLAKDACSFAATSSFGVSVFISWTTSLTSLPPDCVGSERKQRENRGIFAILCRPRGERVRAPLSRDPRQSGFGVRNQQTGYFQPSFLPHLPYSHHLTIQPPLLHQLHRCLPLPRRHLPRRLPKPRPQQPSLTALLIRHGLT